MARQSGLQLLKAKCEALNEELVAVKVEYADSLETISVLKRELEAVNKSFQSLQNAVDRISASADRRHKDVDDKIARFNEAKTKIIDRMEDLLRTIVAVKRTVHGEKGRQVVLANGYMESAPASKKERPLRAIFDATEEVRNDIRNWMAGL